MVSASTPSTNETAKDVILVHTVQLKPMTKAHKKTCLKMLMMMTKMMNKSQEMTVFGGRQKLTSAMKLRPEK